MAKQSRFFKINRAFIAIFIIFFCCDITFSEIIDGPDSKSNRNSLEELLIKLTIISENYSVDLRSLEQAEDLLARLADTAYRTDSKGKLRWSSKFGFYDGAKNSIAIQILESAANRINTKLDSPMGLFFQDVKFLLKNKPSPSSEVIAPLLENIFIKLQNSIANIKVRTQSNQEQLDQILSFIQYLTRNNSPEKLAQALDEYTRAQDKLRDLQSKLESSRSELEKIVGEKYERSQQLNTINGHLAERLRALSNVQTEIENKQRQLSDIFALFQEYKSSGQQTIEVVYSKPSAIYPKTAAMLTESIKHEVLVAFNAAAESQGRSGKQILEKINTHLKIFISNVRLERNLLGFARTLHISGIVVGTASSKSVSYSMHSISFNVVSDSKGQFVKQAELSSEVMQIAQQLIKKGSEIANADEALLRSLVEIGAFQEIELPRLDLKMLTTRAQSILNCSKYFNH